MKRRAYAKNADTNQPGIVATLRAHGAYVHHAGDPFDLLVGYRGAWFVLEVKDGSKPPSAQRLTDKEIESLGKIAGRAGVHIVRTPDEALCAIGAKAWPEVAA